MPVIWGYVREMDNWAPFLRGYQSHEKQSDVDSVWVLKGDVGVLARTVRFQVTVTEWAGPARVSFALRGLNEPMQGTGAFAMEAVGAADPAPAAPRQGPVARLLPAGAAKRRVPGLLEGKGYWIADDFDAALPDELLDLFEGKVKDEGTEVP